VKELEKLIKKKRQKGKAREVKAKQGTDTELMYTSIN